MNKEPDCAADLATLVTEGGGEARRYEADVAGGGSDVRREAVRREHVRIGAVAGGAVRVECDAVAYHGDVEHIEDCPRTVFLEFVPRVAGLPVDWRKWRRLELDVGNGGVAMGVELTVLGARSRLLTKRDFEAGGSATLSVDLTDLPLAAGIMPAYEPQSIRVAFFLAEGGPGGACELRRLALCGERAPGPLVDRWGQRIHAEWPGKVRSDADLIRARGDEERELAAMAPIADRGRYGGWTGGPRFAATGFFRVEQAASGHWWYADPDGLAFWSVGPTCVRVGDATGVVGREEVFAELPAGAPDYVYDEMKRPRLHAMNVHRKYGSLDAWRDRVRERLVKWGCNTVANWSDMDLPAGQIAYVKTLSSRLLATPSPYGRMPDVFDPAWEEALRAHFTAEAAPLARDPWLIGYFVDNEMGWGGLDKAVLEAYAERYFSTVRRVLKEVDPNHLYLGCRFVRVMSDPIIPTIAGRYVDVLSVNAYSIIPRRHEFDAWFAAARRPIQIGEHQFALRDPRGLPTPWMAMTADERRAAVAEYSRAAASLPYCLGTHWFQFQDQPLTGRPSNGENMLIGLVDITDRPYEHMVSAFRQIGEECYGWHEGAKG